MQSPQLSAALQDRLAGGLYHCNYTYEDLLFIEMCSEATPVHCNTVEGKMQSLQLNAALQDRLAAGSVTLQLHLWTFAVHTGVQYPNTSALQHC